MEYNAQPGNEPEENNIPSMSAETVQPGNDDELPEDDEEIMPDEDDVEEGALEDDVIEEGSFEEETEEESDMDQTEEEEKTTASGL